MEILKKNCKIIFTQNQVFDKDESSQLCDAVFGWRKWFRTGEKQKKLIKIRDFNCLYQNVYSIPKLEYCQSLFGNSTHLHTLTTLWCSIAEIIK